MAHRPRKRFGQNFLTDPLVIERIVRAIDPRPDQHIVEIGPGRGAITEALADSGARLTLIELDRDLVALLRQQYADAANVDVVSADALQVDFSSLGADLRVVGNLPYNISTPLLFHVAEHAARVTDMHFMLQKEVVRRIVADPGSKAYGRLSVMLQCRFDAELLFEVGPQSFTPAPKVDSAIVRLRPAAAAAPIADPERFAALVAAAFAQRRKTLRNALREYMAADAILAAGIDPGCRAEQLTVAEFAQLAAGAGKH